MKFPVSRRIGRVLRHHSLRQRRGNIPQPSELDLKILVRSQLVWTGGKQIPLNTSLAGSRDRLLLPPR